MARNETDREDLLREATALVERAELVLPEEPRPVVSGFRRDGSLSIYFGDDPVYQFNSALELRRAYVGGLLYKAEQGRLIELRRERTADEVRLLRRELAAGEERSLLADAEARLIRLARAIDSATARVTEQVPANADVASRTAGALQTVLPHVRIAATPHAR